MMPAHNEPEFPMSIYRTWQLTRRLPLKAALREGLGAYAETR